MIEATHRSGALLAIGHNRRFKNHCQLAKAWLDQGLIGEITAVEAEEGSASDWQRSPAYFDPVQSGGGSLMDVGIHAIDLIRWLVGEFDQVQFSGDGNASRVESEAEMRFRLRNGATGRLVSSRSRELAQRLAISGTDGFLLASLWGDELRVRTNRGKPFRHFPHLDASVSRRPPADSSFVDQLYNLVQAIRGQAPLLVNGAEGMAAVDVVCRAYRTVGAPSLQQVSVSRSWEAR
jgi:predicted dehydrogenase